MGAIETLKFGLTVGAIFTGVILVAFWAYFLVLGRSGKGSHNAAGQHSERG